MSEKLLKNPIDDGWYADPEARFYEGKYVIYATICRPLSRNPPQQTLWKKVCYKEQVIYLKLYNFLFQAYLSSLLAHKYLVIVDGKRAPAVTQASCVTECRRTVLCLPE